jgi:hypothetical protein
LSLLGAKVSVLPPWVRPRRCVRRGKYSAARLSNPEIRERLLAKLATECANEADILVLLGEADARKLYLAEGYPSMHAWCIEFFHFSHEVAFRRIHAARAAREYPLLFAAVAGRRLHLSAVRLLVPHLTPENVEEIVAAATHERRAHQKLQYARALLSHSLPLVCSTVDDGRSASHAALDHPSLRRGRPSG